MNQPSKEPRIENPELEWIDDEDSEESTVEANDDDPYSDEFLDAFLAQELDDDDDPPSYDFGTTDTFDSDGDAEFDRYFRNADSQSRARRRRHHRGHRNWREALDYESRDWRPRR